MTPNHPKKSGSASRPTPDEVIEKLEADLATRPPLEIDLGQLLRDRDADRP